MLRLLVAVLIKFLGCSMKQAFYPLHKQNIARAWQQGNTILQAFRSVPGSQTCMCKRGIRYLVLYEVFSQKFIPNFLSLPSP